MVIVDDGSTDDTPGIVRSFAAEDPRIRLIEQQNTGTAGARNRGFAEANGELISILDNDDLWLPRYLERVSEALAEAPFAGLCHTDAWILDDTTGQIHRKTAVEWAEPRPSVMAADRLRTELMRGNFILASSVTVTREAFEAAGPFNTSTTFRGSDDWDLWLRIAEAGFGAVRPPGVLAVYRERPDSVSRDHVLMMRSALAVATEALERDSSKPEEAEFAARQIAESSRQIELSTSRSPLAKARVWFRRRAGAVRRRLTRSRNWWAPPEPLAAMFQRVDPDRWGAG